MSLDIGGDNKPFEFQMDIGLRFGLFQLSLSHVKLDQLGRVSRFILTALAQEGVSWSHLEQIIGLERAVLKPIENRLCGLGYVNEQGVLTDFGRAMAGVVRLMDMPQRIWVDTSHSDWQCKKRLMVLDKENLLIEAEGPDTLPVLGQQGNQQSISKHQQKKQLDDIQATIESWHHQGIFSDVLKRIWLDGSHLFDRTDIINDLDISCIAVEPSGDLPVSKIVNYTVDLFSGSSESGWKFWRPVLVCQRDVLWNDSVPDCVGKDTYAPEQQYACLLSNQLLNRSIVLKEQPKEPGYFLDSYIDTDETIVLDQIWHNFSSLVTPRFADIKYFFSKAYSELNLGYDSFYEEASDRLQALPLYMDKKSRNGKQ